MRSFPMSTPESRADDKSDDKSVDAVEGPPLAGVKVIDLTIAMAGPLASQRLGDMGADIVKVEAPSEGDLTRVFALAGARIGGETTSFLALNRNKRSICLDLKSEAGRNILLRLVQKSDVLMQNFRPGVADRLGCGYDAVRSINPRIVYCSISGFGDDGPMARHPGQDLLVQAFSGMMFNAGTRSSAPHPAPVYLIDTAASHLATEAILAALLQMYRSGEGQHVKVSLLGAALEMQCQELMTYLHRRKLAPRTSAPFASAWLEPPYGVYPTSNGWMALSQNDLGVIASVVGSDALKRLAGARPSADGADLEAWRDEVYETLQSALQAHSTQHWVDALSAHKVWCGPVQSYEELIAHPQSEQFFKEMKLFDGKEALRTVAPAIWFSQYEATAMRPPPPLGFHTNEILQEIGLSAEQIRRCRHDGVVR